MGLVPKSPRNQHQREQRYHPCGFQWRHPGMWYILVFVMMHIYVVVREDVMFRQYLISILISG